MHYATTQSRYWLNHVQERSQNLERELEAWSLKATPRRSGAGI
jgi:hypothetical protein